MFKRIIVAVDGSTGNERILLFAEHLARVESAALVVVHAYMPPTDYEWTDGWEALQAQYSAVATEVVDDALAVFHGAQLEVVGDLRQGPAAEALLSAAQAQSADLIVMGSRTGARSGSAEALLGSVSSSVLRYAACPVLIVP
jgi:nucleotide-binding universal stress UspA family protein